MQADATTRSVPCHRSPWTIAWIVFAPLLAWLLLAKAISVGSTASFYLTGGPEDSFMGTLRWALHFSWVRFACIALLALAAHRFWLRRRPALSWTLFAALVLALCTALSLKGEDSFIGVLAEQLDNLAGQLRLFAYCALPDVAQVCALVLITGLAVQWLAPAPRRVVVRAIQVLVVLLCVVVVGDIISEIGIGQGLNGAVLAFTFTHLHDMKRVLGTEFSAFRVFLLLAGLLTPLWWAWRWRAVADAAPAPVQRSHWALALAGLGAAAAFLPAISTGLLPFDRFTTGVLPTFAKTLWTTDSFAAQKKAEDQLASTGKPRWHSLEASLVKADATHRRNVVIILLESMRAISTTPFSPQLQTTPYLQRLADQGLLVRDMSANMPRTTGAWMAVLGGQFPLTNEEAEIWTVENHKQQRLKGMPGLLREQGYATGFFTSTALSFMSGLEIVRALGFETIVGSEELGDIHATPVNSYGYADEVLIEPVMAWTRKNLAAGKPVFTTVMTNVGHFPYDMPASWKKRSFAGINNTAHEAYLNCLAYIDGVVQNLMQAYEQAGLLQDTVFVILGDHGQFMGEHGSKQVYNSIYQEGIHIPAIVYAPGLTKPGVVDGPREQVDIMPTVLELLGYQVKDAALPGISLLRHVDPRREIFISSSINHTLVGARIGSRKYIYTFDRTPMEVYDLDSDPSELRPVKDVSPEEIERATRMILEWRSAKELSMFAKPPAQPGGAWAVR